MKKLVAVAAIVGAFAIAPFGAALADGNNSNNSNNAPTTASGGGGGNGYPGGSGPGNS